MAKEMQSKSVEEQFAHKLALVGDAHRLRIICYLFTHNTSCVSDIAKALEIPVANTSHHLRALATAEVVVCTRQGKTMCYTLSNDTFAVELKNFICKFKIL